MTYVAVGWIIRTFYYNNIDREMANDVQQGHIAAKLARPVNYQGMQISQAIGESVFRLIMFTIPTGAVILLIYPVQAPISGLAAGGFPLVPSSIPLSSSLRLISSLALVPSICSRSWGSFVPSIS